MFRPLTPYLFLALPLGLMALFFFVPLLMAFRISLLDYGHDLYTPAFVGLENYQRLAASPLFWRALGNTFFFVLGVVPALMTLPMVMAVLFNGQLRGMAVFRTLVYIPVILSMVVVAIAWRWLYANDGLINYGLSLLHLPKVGWLVDPDVALAAVMVVVVWKGLAYYMMMYLANLQSVSQDLYEAAAIDGASLWRRHWHVTLPHLRPTLALVMVISTIGCLKGFTEIYVLTQGGPLGATQTLAYYIYDRAFGNLDLGLASAAGLVLMGLLLGLSVLQMRMNPPEDSAPTPRPKAGAVMP